MLRTRLAIQETFMNKKDLYQPYIKIIDDRWDKHLRRNLRRPKTRGSVDYPSTRGIQVDIGLPDATSENRAESLLYGELYPIKIPA